MPLPYSPEPMEKLQERLPDALQEIYLYPNSSETRPGTQRKHVFDTEHGIRLIVSRATTDVMDDPFLHVSTSSRRSLSKERAMKEIVLLFDRSMAGRYLGQSKAGVLHFRFPDHQPSDIR